MAFDAHGTLVATLLTNAPGAGGTTFNVTAGTGALFPAVPFNCTVWTANTLPVRAASQLGIPNSALAEVVRVTNVTGDVLTVTRAQENTTAQNWGVGAVIGNTITALDITAIEANALGGTVTTLSEPVTAGHMATFADTTGKILQDGGAPATGTVTPTGSITSGHIATFADNTGTVIQDGGALPTGNVTGAASSADGDVVLFNGTTGKTIKDSGAAFTAAGIGLGNVTNDAQTKAAVVPNTAPAAGNLLVGNAGGTAYAPVSMSGDASLSSAGVAKVTGFNGQNMVSSTGSGAASYSSALPILLVVKTVAVKTTGSPTDLATISVPFARYRAVVFQSSTNSLSGVYAESAAGTLAGSNFTFWSAPNGTGDQMSVQFSGPTGAGAFVATVANSSILVSTSNTIYIRQNTNSANAGVLSFYIFVMPVP